MRVVESSQYPRRDLNPRIAAAADVPRQTLRATVDAISYPRHYVEQPRANARAAAWIEAELQSYGYQTERQGEFGNIVTTPRSDAPQILIGAHYDSKPNTPGADDNASAVAAMLAAAKAVSENGSDRPVMFVAFNREEEDLLGSQDFVRNFLPSSGLQLAQVHILEMVGFANAQPRSQRLPRGLPVRLVRDRGDFLALLGNNRSTFLVDSVMQTARTYAPRFPVLGLKIWFGLEKRFHHLRRSDHAPFWQARQPALMWTDTAEFRNPHYHQPSDTPETLDYDFLRSVTRLLIAHALGGAVTVHGGRRWDRLLYSVSCQWSVISGQ